MVLVFHGVFTVLCNHSGGWRKEDEREVVQVYCSFKIEVQHCFKSVKQEIPFLPGKAQIWSSYYSALYSVYWNKRKENLKRKCPRYLHGL